MKLFWFLILVLVLLASGLSAERIFGLNGGQVDGDDASDASDASGASGRAGGAGGALRIELPPMVVYEVLVVEHEYEGEGGGEDGAIEEIPVVDTTFEDAMQAMLDRRGGVVAMVDEPEPLPESLIVGPGFEVLGDGGLVVDGVEIFGDGSLERPFVLSWDVLRGVGLVYEPRKGKRELPDWLDVIDGKHVRIEGHTLLPVIASSTRELVVMENPWDGCCLGVPPTPYDAVEVRLVQSVDFGSSSVGYGQVDGVFRVDPYVVSGWVMGLFVIEGGAYRSAPGTPMVEF